jgi:predicted amidophosphoribosyltransferase
MISLNLETGVCEICKRQAETPLRMFCWDCFEAIERWHAAMERIVEEEQRLARAMHG